MRAPGAAGPDCAGRPGDRFFVTEIGRVNIDPVLTVDDLMADIAVIFHWPPSEMNGMTLTELMEWRYKALQRSGVNTDE
ncbi:Phage P2 GpE [compost metagenome]